MSEQKCNFVGCEAMGEPIEGYDFFACESCMEELDRCCQVEYSKKRRSESMSWHYQIRKRTQNDRDVFDIIERYVNPDGWTAREIAPCGETAEELVCDLEMMLNDARKHPVFEEPQP